MEGNNDNEKLEKKLKQRKNCKAVKIKTNRRKFVYRL